MTPTRALILASTVWASTVSAVDITECGQLVRAGEVGELRRDLECAATVVLASTAVIVDHGGTLNLNGHTLRGDGSGNGVGVGCFLQSRKPNDAPCTVNGPGEITAFWAAMNGGGCTIVARDVTLRANAFGIVGALVCNVRLSHVSVTDSQHDGVWGWKVLADDVDVSGNGGSGIVAHVKLDAANARITGNGDRGVKQISTSRRARGRIRDSVVTDNQGLFDVSWVGPLRLRGTVCDRAAKVRYRRIPTDDDYQEIVVRRPDCPGA